MTPAGGSQAAWPIRAVRLTLGETVDLRMPQPIRSLPAHLLALPLLALGSTPAVEAASLPYPEAVGKARLAAEAVLQRAGRESCLRGKLNRALLKLSESCEASGQSSSPLCSLSDRAVVVTPMSLSFMDATSKQLLELSAPQPKPSL